MCWARRVKKCATRNPSTVDQINSTLDVSPPPATVTETTARLAPVMQTIFRLTFIVHECSLDRLTKNTLYPFSKSSLSSFTRICNRFHCFLFFLFSLFFLYLLFYLPKLLMAYVFVFQQISRLFHDRRPLTKTNATPTINFRMT